MRATARIGVLISLVMLLAVRAHGQTFEFMFGANGGDGTPGAAFGEFNTPTDVKVNTAGEIFVSDRVNQRIQVFDAGGVFLQYGGWRRR